MKKIILTVLFIFVLSIAMETKSFAYSDIDIANELLQDLRIRLNNQNIGTTSEFLNLASFWSQNPEYILLIGGSGGDFYYRVGNWNNINSTSAQLVSNGYYVNFYTTRGNTFLNGSMTAATYSFSNPINKGNLSSFMPVVIDTFIYDSLIFSPNFSVNNNLHSGTENIDLSFVQLSDNNEYNTDITFYTYVKMYLYTANDILVDYGKYTVTSYFKSDPIVIYDYSDMHIPTIGTSLDLNAYKSSAQSFLEDALPDVNYNFVSGMSSGTQLNRTTDYINNVYKGFPHFVNGVEIWVQNFYVEDNIAYVSDWKKWNSKRYSDYNNVVPVSDNQPANGIITVESDTGLQQPNNNDTYNPICVDTTASSQGVVINNFTPNYPDYPTAVSYNHDNLLVQFIQTANYLPQMFSGYSSFLAGAFGFIPGEIWTIIGFGFLGSIAVMIVKVL